MFAIQLILSVMHPEELPPARGHDPMLLPEESTRKISTLGQEQWCRNHLVLEGLGYCAVPDEPQQGWVAQMLS